MLNKRIAELRKKQGWSQTELARRLHISPSAVGMYEQGRREPPLDVLIAISEEFAVTLDYLIAGKIGALNNPGISSHIDVGRDLLKPLPREEQILLLVSLLLQP